MVCSVGSSCSVFLMFFVFKRLWAIPFFILWWMMPRMGSALLRPKSVNETLMQLDRINGREKIGA